MFVWAFYGLSVQNGGAVALLLGAEVVMKRLISFHFLSIYILMSLIHVSWFDSSPGGQAGSITHFETGLLYAGQIYLTVLYVTSWFWWPWKELLTSWRSCCILKKKEKFPKCTFQEFKSVLCVFSRLSPGPRSLLVPEQLEGPRFYQQRKQFAAILVECENQLP